MEQKFKVSILGKKGRTIKSWIVDSKEKAIEDVLYIRTWGNAMYEIVGVTK